MMRLLVSDLRWREELLVLPYQCLTSVVARENLHELRIRKTVQCQSMSSDLGGYLTSPAALPRKRLARFTALGQRRRASHTVTCEADQGRSFLESTPDCSVLIMQVVAAI